MPFAFSMPMENLHINGIFNIDSSAFDLSQVTFTIGWDKLRKQSTFWHRLLGIHKHDLDLDAFAFFLNGAGKLNLVGKERLLGSDVVFFNNKTHPDGFAWLSQDSKGAKGKVDVEKIVIKLSEIPENYKQIILLTTLYQAQKRNQHLGVIRNAFLKANDASGQEILRFNFGTEVALKNACSIIFARLEREENGGWRFHALGQTSKSDNFVAHLKPFLP